jgi:hypothetical protein
VCRFPRVRNGRGGPRPIRQKTTQLAASTAAHKPLAGAPGPAPLGRLLPLLTRRAARPVIMRTRARPFWPRPPTGTTVTARRG